MPADSFRTQPVEAFLASLAEKTPTPGGGAGAGIVGTTACALAGMVVAYSIGKKNLAEHEPALLDAQSRLARARTLMLDLSDEDAAAYGAVNELSRLPEDDPRRAGLPGARCASVQVPLAVLAACADVLRLLESLAPITNRHLRSDLAIAAVLAAASARAAVWNVRVNIEGLRSPDGPAPTLAEAERLLQDCRDRAERVEAACGA